MRRSGALEACRDEAQAAVARQWQALSQNWWPRASPLDVKVALLKAREIEAAVRERRSAEQDTRPDLTPAQADEFYASLGATP